MKRWRWLLPIATLIMLLPGCTSNAKYQEALDQNAALSSQVADLNSQITNLSGQVSTLQTNYEKISKVFPPRDFTSLQELKDWVAKDKTDQQPAPATIEELYSRGLKMQLAALNDGFIISIDQEFVTDAFFFIFGIAVVNNEIWVWDIEDDDLYQPIGWGTVTRNS
ncbi:hypothetical protein [Dehalogenimonas sp. 4OHTPN]|uniref:Uncharacterized protein n=1 Tax=Dehalogenimonas sp. 4OHTPN TaxID=3166643 RepID=A0AAU8GE83_9CHLR